MECRTPMTQNCLWLSQFSESLRFWSWALHYPNIESFCSTDFSILSIITFSWHVYKSHVTYGYVLLLLFHFLMQTHYSFFSVAVEISVTIGPDALELLTEIVRYIWTVINKVKSWAYIIQCILVAVPQGNAAAVMGQLGWLHVSDIVAFCFDFGLSDCCWFNLIIYRFYVLTRCSLWWVHWQRMIQPTRDFGVKVTTIPWHCFW